MRFSGSDGIVSNYIERSGLSLSLSLKIEGKNEQRHRQGHTMINARTHRKFERAAKMKFVAILHKGHWGDYANCADRNGVVWEVNKKTGAVRQLNDEIYKNGCFVMVFKEKPLPTDKVGFMLRLKRLFYTGKKRALIKELPKTADALKW